MDYWLTFLTLLTCLASSAVGQSNFRIGRGFADMTGLVSEGALYGYANPNQDARGLHLRQYSRAFVFEGDDGSRAALVVTDNCMISQALHYDVMERLSALYGDLYTAENVMLAPQHSHGTPGGFHAYYMYQIVSLGWINETTQAYIDGIVKSIQLAHDDLQDGDVYMNSGEVLDANINRSPYSYDNNPEEEKARYEHNVGKEMTILKLVSAGGEDMGMASIFPVHTTSMKNFNHLVSTDNKGYAAQMFEREMNSGDYPSQVNFVAGFAQGALGDASPNTLGERCNGTNDFCSYNTSTCPENWEDPALCTGRGPANEQFEDTREIGSRQHQAARDLYLAATQRLGGQVDHRFMWVNMSDVVADIAGGQQELCRPSMGYSFAAGATDGPGLFPFFQGMLQGIPALDDLVDAVFGPPQSLMDCHLPKPVLLPTGILDDSPWPWQPSIVPLQIIRIGDVILVGVPGEITTMAGRRVAEAIKAELVANGYPDTTHVAIVGIANLYSSYIVTREEYQVQRYEGASTIYGQYTLEGYVTKFVELASALATDSPVPLGDAPPDLRGFPDPALDPVLTDALEADQTHGDVITDVLQEYQAGETAFATFVAGNPRNDIKTDGTFVEVQRQEGDSSWSVEYTDVHWETKFIWLSNCQERPPFCFLPNITGCTPYNISEFKCWEEQFSNATVEWDIPANQEPGTYRLVHYGDAKMADGSVTSYTGVSSSFDVISARGPVFRRHSEEYYKATGEDEQESGQPDNLLDFLRLYFGDGALSVF